MPNVPVPPKAEQIYNALMEELTHGDGGIVTSETRSVMLAELERVGVQPGSFTEREVACLATGIGFTLGFLEVEEDARRMGIPT